MDFIPVHVSGLVFSMDGSHPEEWVWRQGVGEPAVSIDPVGGYQAGAAFG
jgi:hypothetical protein